LHGEIAVAHNGELINAAALRKKVCVRVRMRPSVLEFQSLLSQKYLNHFCTRWDLLDLCVFVFAGDAPWRWSVDQL
jgi:glutamine phosphoribosylpyrophosphate amidotransferase